MFQRKHKFWDLLPFKKNESPGDRTQARMRLFGCKYVNVGPRPLPLKLSPASRCNQIFFVSGTHFINLLFRFSWCTISYRSPVCSVVSQYCYTFQCDDLPMNSSNLQSLQTHHNVTGCISPPLSSHPRHRLLSANHPFGLCFQESVFVQFCLFCFQIPSRDETLWYLSHFSHQS